jgi:hypothetical protein
MQGDAGALNAHVLQSGQQRRIKVQRRRGCRRCARVFGKNGLVTLGVLRVLAVFVALYIGRQWHMAMGLHQAQRLIAQAEPKQGPIHIGPSTQQRGFKSDARTIAVEHAQHRAHSRFFAHLHVCHHLVGRLALHKRQDPLHQQLQLPAAGFFAKQTRWHNLRVVEHQQVALLQQSGQVFEDAVHRHSASAIEQARRAALGRWGLGDQFGGEVKVKVAQYK